MSKIDKQKYIIELNKISKKLGKNQILKDLDFSVANNNIHGLIGPNGSGKTTILRIISGLYNIDSGTQNINGEISMLLENDYLYEELRGIENIEIFGTYFKISPEGLKNTMKKYLSYLNLEEDLNKKVSHYSKGMKRKLSLLITICRNTNIILLDEVTSGVDPISRVEIRKLLLDLKNEGKTILITSHDLNEIQKIADRVTMIKEGRAILELDKEEFKNSNLEEIFIKEGEKNE